MASSPFLNLNSQLFAHRLASFPPPPPHCRTVKVDHHRFVSVEVEGIGEFDTVGEVTELLAQQETP